MKRRDDERSAGQPVREVGSEQRLTPARDERTADLLSRLERALGERYRIERQLGQGAMAIVFRAEDLKHQRHVAIKVLKPALAQSIGAERFLREIQIAAQLAHPHILPLYDSGKVDGLLYYVMPYVEGESLRERLHRERQLSVEDALRITREVASALAHAHAQGLVHRDIKPENVLLQAGYALVSDFGIARAIDKAGGDRLTETGLAVGTPEYMSPEQAAAESSVDARSDIYSLGCVLYEMLAGDPPYTGSTPQAILARKAVEPLPSLRVVRESLPAPLETVIMKALAKVPADRFATAAQFGDGLDRAFTAPAVSAPRARRLDRASALALAGLLVIALAGAGWWISTTVLAPARIRSLAVLPFDNLGGDSTQQYFVAGMHNALIGELAQIGALRVISRRSVMRYQESDKSIPEIARELNVEGFVEGSVTRMGDSVRLRVQLIRALPDERNLWVHAYARSISDVLGMHGEVARAIAGQVRARLTPQQETRLAENRPVNPETYEAYLRGMFHLHKRGPENVQRGVAFLREAVEKDPGDPLAYAGLALGYGLLGHGPTALPDVWPHARAAALRAVTLDSTMAEAHAALAEAKLYYEWDWAGAERAFKRALELNPNFAMAHYHYAWYLALFGRVDEAIAEHKRAQELDPLTPGHTAWLGTLYGYQGRYDEGIVEALKSLELNPDFVAGLYVLGSAYAAKGMYQEAIAAHEKLATLYPLWKNALGETYARAGREAEARKILAELEAEKTTPWVAYNLARLYAALGENDKAFLWLAYEPHHAFVPWFRVAPELAQLRADPRFQDFLRRLKLPS